MGGYDSTFNFRNGQLNNDDQTRGMTLEETGRPDYALLWRKAGRLMRSGERHNPPLTLDQIPQWSDMKTDLKFALLPLTSGLPGSEIESTGDTKTEQSLIEPAFAEATKFIALYHKTIKQPPPEDLQMIEQVLRHRRESLQQLHPPRSPNL